VYLSKLEIFGFKSFADRMHVDFDDGMTAIVGPNGCGKTNIVDAVRWAIGEQKASVLRSSTMENVIFNGTKNRKPLGFAEVSLTIQNTKGILPSEYTEIRISRRCFRDGTSNYMLNGVNCRLKDITALFMDTGMGSDAYSVIELKMVNEILSHRTQDRRKLFEEAAGITKYKERRRESLYKLEVAKENLNEANIEIRNRQRTVAAYERIAQKQQEAKEISGRLKEIELDYHTRSLSKLVDDTKQVEGLLKQKEDEREKIQVKLNENDGIIDKYKSELEDTEKRLNVSRDMLNEINLNINEVQTSISIAEQRIKYLRENIERFSREKIEIESEIEKLKREKLNDEERIKVLTADINKLNLSQATKKEIVENIELKVKRSKEELRDLSIKHASVTKELTEKQNEYEISKNRLEAQLERCGRLTDENSANMNKHAELGNQKNNLEKEAALLNDEYEKLNREFKERRKLKENLKDEIIKLERDIIYRETEIERLLQKIEIQERLAETLEDYSEGVRYIVKDRNETFAGVVIDKLEVEDKFKTAIETALGEISNYLIVNDENAAKRLIDVLKENEKGKVTFIVKDNLYKNAFFNIFQDEFPEILSQQGVYGWADKFIKCPDEYWPLFCYLLDEYIIVEDFETAMKLSKDNFIKFITLDGDIITNSFLRAGSKTAADTLKLGREKLILELKTQQKTLITSLEGDKINLESLKSSLNDIDIVTPESDLKNTQLKINNLENRIEQFRYQQEQTDLLIDANNREIEELNRLNKELNSKTDDLIQAIEQAENTKYQREKELEHLTTELESLADSLTVKREEFNIYNIEITKSKAELDNLRSDIIRNEESIKSKLNNIEARALESNEYELEIKKLNSELESYTDNSAAGFKPKLKQLETSRAGIESDFSFIRSEYEVKRNLIDRVDQEQRSLRTSRDGIIDHIHKSEMQLTKDRIEIKEHKDRIKEEYEIDIEYRKFDDNSMFDFVKTKSEIDRLKNKLRQLGGSGQLELGIYEQEKAELERLVEQKEDLIRAEADLIHLIDDLNKTAQQKFLNTFELIRHNFNGIFRELFMEGDEADLKLVIDPENPDPLDAKIDIIAKPRGKRPQLIDLLSGGEKTLTAIALLFAIYQVKPSPFCILDEVDAPLDDANIDRFIKIIRKFSKDTQFIIVTHNKRTMEAADSMYGVTMAEQGISTIVNVKFNDDAAREAI